MILIFITMVQIILEFRKSKGDVCKMNILILWVSFCTLDFLLLFLDQTSAQKLPEVGLWFCGGHLETKCFSFILDIFLLFLTTEIWKKY